MRTTKIGPLFRTASTLEVNLGAHFVHRSRRCCGACGDAWCAPSPRRGILAPPSPRQLAKPSSTGRLHRELLNLPSCPTPHPQLASRPGVPGASPRAELPRPVHRYISWRSKGRDHPGRCNHMYMYPPAHRPSPSQYPYIYRSTSVPPRPRTSCPPRSTPRRCPRTPPMAKHHPANWPNPANWRVAPPTGEPSLCDD